jgi:hypothetical protein
LSSNSSTTKKNQKKKKNQKTHRFNRLDTAEKRLCVVNNSIEGINENATQEIQK